MNPENEHAIAAASLRLKLVVEWKNECASRPVSRVL